MDVSVIIINYHSSEYTKACIDSINKYTKKLKFEIIVVDNKSSKTDLQNLKQFHQKNSFKLIESKYNLCFGGGNQLGFQFATGNYIAFINNDTLLTENSLLKLKEYSEVNPKTGALSITQLDTDGKPFKYAFRQYIDLKYHLLGQQKPKKHYSKKHQHNLTKKPFEVDIVSGAFMFFNTKTYEECGGFDTNIFLFYEEMDICKRLNKLGYKNIFFPETNFIHFQGKSSENINIKKEFLISYLYVIQKNYSFIYSFTLKAILLFKYAFKSIIKPKKYIPLTVLLLKGGNSIVYSLKNKA